MTHAPIIYTTPETKMRIPNFVIYKPGDTGIQTTVTNGIADYTDLTADQYLAKHPGCQEMPFDMALDMIKVAEEKKYIKPWIEVSEDRWYEMLEVLPPIRWTHTRGIEFFQICEMTTGNLTATFARVQLTTGEYKHFEATRRTSDSYDKLSVEVLAVV